MQYFTISSKVKRNSIFLLAFLGVGGLFLFGNNDTTIMIKADDQVVVQAGEQVYQVHCASCHGANLEGQPDWRTRDASGLLPAPPHDANGHTWHHSDGQLFGITKHGLAEMIGDDSYKTMMPIYKDILSDEEIIAVLSFIKSTWPAEQLSWQEEVNLTANNETN